MAHLSLLILEYLDRGREGSIHLRMFGGLAHLRELLRVVLQSALLFPNLPFRLPEVGGRSSCCRCLSLLRGGWRSLVLIVNALTGVVEVRASVRTILSLVWAVGHHH